MEEMLEDTLEMDEDEELEQEADEEVDKVLFELTNGKLGQAGSVQTELPVSLLYLAVYYPRWNSVRLLRDVAQSQQDQLDEEAAEREMEKY